MPPQSHWLQGLLEHWQGVFAQSEDDHGCTNAAPIRQRHRPVTPSLYEELRMLLRDMLDGGFVRELQSVGYSSGVSEEEGWLLEVLC